MCADTSANRPLPDAAAVRPSPLGRASIRPARLVRRRAQRVGIAITSDTRSEEHTSELQSRLHLVCRLLLEKKKHLADLSSSPVLRHPFVHRFPLPSATTPHPRELSQAPPLSQRNALNSLLILQSIIPTHFT